MKAPEWAAEHGVILEDLPMDVQHLIWLEAMAPIHPKQAERIDQELLAAASRLDARLRAAIRRLHESEHKDG